MDLSAERLGKSADHPRFDFVEGDISINKEWIEYHVKKADVILPLVAIATPKVYGRGGRCRSSSSISRRTCASSGRCIGTASGSSSLHLRGVRDVRRQGVRRGDVAAGPRAHRQGAVDLLVLQADARPGHLAYGRQGLAFTLFRPFNWIGPRLDSIETAKEGSSRVVTQFIADLYLGKPIQVVDGGEQRRCFTYVDDGIAG